MSFGLPWGFSRSFCRWVTAIVDCEWCTLWPGRSCILLERGASYSSPCPPCARYRLVRRHTRGMKLELLQKFVKLSPCVTGLGCAQCKILPFFIRFNDNRLTCLCKKAFLSISQHKRYQLNLNFTAFFSVSRKFYCIIFGFLKSKT